jgi:hypothetical protein
MSVLSKPSVLEGRFSQPQLEIAMSRRLEAAEASLTELTETVEELEIPVIPEAPVTFGTTAERPAEPADGQFFFDSTLGVPIWFNGTMWVVAAGTDADL